MTSIARSQLVALGRKYRTLTEWRRRSGGVASAELRALAGEFPGALRELDALPLEVLDERLAAVARAESGEQGEAWIEGIVAYHRRMRVALAVKRRLGAVRCLEPALARAIAEQVAAELNEHCAPTFVEGVAKPPGGRLNHVVFRYLESELGKPRAELEQLLFPKLRARPASH
ncbi:MAG TPA: hypothetical protein VER33_13580 [Polyangiaceae bacterium]|nr:hypothetical protein [Polyangiaceae bacterium]